MTVTVASIRARPVVAAAGPWAHGMVTLAQLQSLLLVALLPPLFFGLYNTGRQANLAIAGAGSSAVPAWRNSIIEALGAGYDSTAVAACALHGFVILLPIVLTALVTAEIWRRIFARTGRAEAIGFAASALVFSLALPPTMPLWQVAVGLSFGIVLGKEIFGGTGMNFLNPALVGLAFLYFAYPASMRGPGVWSPVEGVIAAPPMVLASASGLAGIHTAGITWFDAFLGTVPGPLGATSTLACLLGAIVLLLAGFVSWRILVGGLVGVIAAAVLFSRVAPASMPMAALPWYWHLNIGGFAYALVFLAGDPVTSACTNPGRWVYGIFVGALTVLVRVANPAQTEAALLAALLASVVAPLVDYGFVWANIRRRMRRHG